MDGPGRLPSPLEPAAGAPAPRRCPLGFLLMLPPLLPLTDRLSPPPLLDLCMLPSPAAACKLPPLLLRLGMPPVCACNGPAVPELMCRGGSGGLREGCGGSNGAGDISYRARRSAEADVDIGGCTCCAVDWGRAGGPAFAFRDQQAHDSCVCVCVYAMYPLPDVTCQPSHGTTIIFCEMQLGCAKSRCKSYKADLRAFVCHALRS